MNPPSTIACTMVLPFCCASVRTSSACVFCKTFLSTKRSRTCSLFILPGYLRAQSNLEGGALRRRNRQSGSERARRARILVGYVTHYLAHIRNRYRDYFVGRGQTGKNFAHAVLTQSA